MSFKLILKRVYPKCPSCNKGYLKYNKTTILPDEDGNYGCKESEIHECTSCCSVYELIDEEKESLEDYYNRINKPLKDFLDAKKIGDNILL